MTERVKLTKPQRLLLERLSTYLLGFRPGHKTAAKLIAVGLAENLPQRSGHWLLRITPAGCAYLAEDRA